MIEVEPGETAADPGAAASVAERDATAARASVIGLLERMGLIDAAQDASAEPLSGGVSSDIWLVRAADRALVLKRPLPKLKVAADWEAPLDRGASEAAWLEYVADAVPGACPRVLGTDDETFSIALEYLDPGHHRNWKTDLLAGQVDAAFAGAVGADLGRIHSASARTPGLAGRFDHQDLFESLRIEPYLLRTAQAVPEAREPLGAIVATLRTTRRALVHGDVSPKNILVGEHPVFLDAECATWSDPAFDAAFCLNHLALKQFLLPARAGELRAAADAFTAGYLAQVDWEDAADVAARVTRLVPALLLARIDGASPVEYLDPPARAVVRGVALAALRAGVPWEEFAEGAPTS